MLFVSFFTGVTGNRPAECVNNPSKGSFRVRYFRGGLCSLCSPESMRRADLSERPALAAALTWD
jgi:hypothetical protein